MNHEVEARALVAMLEYDGQEVGELLGTLDVRALFNLNVAAHELSVLSRQMRQQALDTPA